jgi:hypothetical protein
LVEPDRPELQLYPSLARHLSARRFLAQLADEPETYVFQNTSAGGRRGHGPLKQPDFTLASESRRPICGPERKLSARTVVLFCEENPTSSGRTSSWNTAGVSQRDQTFHSYTSFSYASWKPARCKFRYECSSI